MLRYMLDTNHHRQFFVTSSALKGTTIMIKLNETLNSALTTADTGKAVEIDKLAELVESQIDNVLGGGYSQYAAYHAKDANQAV